MSLQSGDLSKTILDFKLIRGKTIIYLISANRLMHTGWILRDTENTDN